MSAPTTSASAPASTDIVKVNNANLVDLKNACDDALKRFLSRPDLFKQSYVHTDVRLALGWLGVFVAAGTGYYGWRTEFEESKSIVWAGVLLYVFLTSAQTLYAYFIERDTVFVGRRKTLDKRIVTEHITISSTTTPSSPTQPSPSYSLRTTRVRTASAGKTLLDRSTGATSRPYSDFFDSQGVLDVPKFESWLGELVATSD